jgi:hypothetical protein
MNYTPPTGGGLLAVARATILHAGAMLGADGAAIGLVGVVLILLGVLARRRNEGRS